MKILMASKKFDKKKYMSLVLLIIMAGSTLAYSILQSFGRSQGNNSQTVELPDQAIINYELTTEQRNFAIKKGIVILEYKYPLLCEECSTQKAFLESNVKEFSGQLLLEELVDNNRAESSLSVMSFYGSTSLVNPSNDEIFNALCEFMIEPPIICATRNV